MKKIILFSAIAALITSCQITRPYTATNNPIGSKTGVSKTTYLGASFGDNLANGIIFNGKFGVIDAARNGKITKVATVDVKTTNYVLFRKAEIIVTGE